jgi:DNA-binding NtrC family response regulator
VTDPSSCPEAVLVCHPDESMRTAYERTLAEEGYTVRSTSESELPSSDWPQVRAVVLSPEMPGFSSAALQGELEGTHTRAALLVPFGESAPATASLPDRVDECLAEPVPDERLVDAVEALLARAQYDAQLRECFDLARRLASAEADPDTEPSEVRHLRDRLRKLRAELGDPDGGMGPVDRFAVAAESEG